MMKNTQTTIAITGGHLAPALAVIEALKKKYRLRIIFFGRKHAFSPQQDITLEYRLFSKEKAISFYDLQTTRLSGVHIVTLLRAVFLIGRAVLRAVHILKQHRPAFIISFGGYVGIPTALAGWLLGIPLYLHEQTAVPGKANRFMAIMAKTIFTAFPEAASYFPPKKTKHIGNPIRTELFNAHKPSWLPAVPAPLILILGGTTGSHRINILIEQILKPLTKDFLVVHQIGESKYKDFERLKSYHIKNYVPVRFITSSELGYLYKKAALLISRSGANTFFDLIYFKIPAILIPLPVSSYSEQQIHARILSHHGAAQIHRQEEKADKLYDTIIDILTHRQQYQNAYQKLKKYENCIITGDEFIQYLPLP